MELAEQDDEEQEEVDLLDARLTGMPELDENNCYWRPVSDEDDEVCVLVDALVGRRIEVYWEESETWFSGEVYATDDARLGSHRVKYDEEAREAARRKKPAPMWYSWLSGERPSLWHP